MAPSGLALLSFRQSVSLAGSASLSEVQRIPFDTGGWKELAEVETRRWWTAEGAKALR